MFSADFYVPERDNWGGNVNGASFPRKLGLLVDYTLAGIEAEQTR